MDQNQPEPEQENTSSGLEQAMAEEIKNTNNQNTGLKDKLKLGIFVASIAAAGFFAGYFGKGIIANSIYETKKSGEQEYLVAGSKKIPINPAGENLLLGEEEYATQSIKTFLENSPDKNYYLNDLAVFGLQNMDTVYTLTLDGVVGTAKKGSENNIEYSNLLLESALNIPINNYSEQNTEKLASKLAQLAVTNPVLYHKLEKSVNQQIPEASTIQKIETQTKNIAEDVKESNWYNRLKDSYHDVKQVVLKKIIGE